MIYLITEPDTEGAVLIEADNEAEAVSLVLRGNGTHCPEKEASITADGSNAELILTIYVLPEVGA